MKNKCCFLLSIFLLLLNLHALSQRKKVDVVYLKTGNVIRGTITEMIPGQSIKIQTEDQSLFVFKMDEVEKIDSDFKKQYDLPVKTFLSGFDAGYMSGAGKSVASNLIQPETHLNNYHSFSFRFIEAYRFLKNSSMGGGIGYEMYSTDDPTYLPNTQYIPIFTHARTSFPLRGNVLPGINMDFGYDIGLTHNMSRKFRGGPFFNPALCLQIKENALMSFFFYIGYEYQSHAIEFEGIFDDPLPILFSNHFLTFRFGIEF